MLRSTIHLPPIEEGEFLLCYVKFSYILFYFSLFNCILYSVVNSDYLSDKLKKAIKKQEPMSDFPVHVIYIVSD